MHGHRDFNLLPLDEPLQIGVNQTTAHGINLPVVEHHFAGADALDINREDRVVSGLRAENRRQITKRGDGRNSFALAAVNGHGNESL